MKILRLNAFSSKVYGVHDDGSVVVTDAGGALLCEIDASQQHWKSVTADKVPVTLRRWIQENT
jgi:hypothetical protein